MKNFIALGLIILTTGLMAQTKKEQDRNAILAMEGCYKVTFDFAETFSPDTSYEYHDRYHSWGIEYVFAIEDSEDFISLQHLLIINDSTIIKHWRQDWVYEENTLLTYDRDKTWKHISYSPEEVKGTWTQKVYQVDDSPRYESKGTWVHVDGKHFWEGTGDAPLPRREFSKRDDYNVMRRHSRIELSDNGWFLEQDNEKIVRDDSGDKLICHEKGMESFTTGDYNCQPAIDWWEKNQMYWGEVRTAWNEVFDSNEKLQLIKKVDDKMLWQQLFELGDEVSSEEKPKEVKTRAKEIIEAYIKA
jgi:hypothetical protein